MPTWFFWPTLTSSIVMLFSGLAFGRLTVARIERDIKADDLPRPCPWDGPGFRMMWYAWAICLPVGRFNRLDDPTIDVPTVRRYMKPQDIFIGWVMILSSSLFSIAAIIFWFVWYEQ